MAGAHAILRPPGHRPVRFDVSAACNLVLPHERVKLTFATDSEVVARAQRSQGPVRSPANSAGSADTSFERAHMGPSPKARASA